METRHYYLITPLAYTGKSTAFTYHHDGAALSMGQIVEIPIARRVVVGIVDEEVLKPAFATRSLSRVLDLPLVPAELCQLAGWMAKYYAASPASVWSTILPAGIAKAGVSYRPPSR